MCDTLPLPRDIVSCVREFLMPSPQDVRRAYARVLLDLSFLFEVANPFVIFDIIESLKPPPLSRHPAPWQQRPWSFSSQAGSS